MSLLTLAQVREHVESDLGDDAMQRVIDGADAEIIRRLGVLATHTHVTEGGEQLLHLPRKASSISSVTERYAVSGGSYTNVSLSADDYTLYSDGRRAERLNNGTNPADLWQGTVTVVFVPADAGSAERSMLLVNLVKLELAYTGRLSEGIGDVRVQSAADHSAAKAALFAALLGAGRRLLT